MSIEGLSINGVVHQYVYDSLENDPNFEDMLGLTPLRYLKDKSIIITGTTADIENPVTEANWSCCVAPCVAGDVFTVKGYGGGSTRLWGFVDADGTVLSVSVSALHTSRYVIVNAPENAAYFVSNSKYTELETIAFKGNIYITYADKVIQFYPTTNGGVYFEEDKTAKIVYFTFTNHFAVRYGENGTAFPIGELFRGFYKPSQYNSEMNPTAYVNIEDSTGLSVVTSPGGLTECIPIQDDYSLVFDLNTTLLKVVSRYNVTRNQIVLVANDTGSIIDLHSSLQKFYTSKLIEDSKETEENPIPSYWDSAITEAETSINEYLSASKNTAVFGFVTDTHIGSNKGYSGLLLEKVMKDCHIPTWFHGGDAVTGSSLISRENLIAQMADDFKQFANVENRCLRAIGNHEPCYGISNHYDHNLTNGAIDYYYHGVDAEKDLQVYGDAKGYFYRDVPKDKMRYIVLDMLDFDSMVDNNELVTGSGKLNFHKFGQTQLLWFASVLNDVPENYGVVICSHMVPVSLEELRAEFDSTWTDSYPIDYAVARGICNAYINKSTYTYNGSISGDSTGDTYAINADFSNANGDLVCWIGGHSHRDFIITKDNIKFVATANDSISVSSNPIAYRPDKTAGTNTEQVLDFFCINKDTRTVNIVRLGAYIATNGKVRTITY